MYLNYLGGKTNRMKRVHVYYLTEYGKVNGWLPDESTLNEWLQCDSGIYTQPTLWGYHVVEIQ